MTASLSDIAAILDQKSAPILLVDDGEGSQALLSILKKNNYYALLAKTPEEAEHLIEKNVVSVLIVFHKASGPSGLHFLEQVKGMHPLIEGILIGYEIPSTPHPAQFLMHPFSDDSFITLVQDRFRFFQLKYEHLLLNRQLKEHEDALKEAKKTFARDLLLGKQIHKMLLLDTPPADFPGVKMAVSSHPSKSIDGDFISFYKPAPHLLDFVMGDVMGKGLCSALIGTSLKGLITKYAQNQEDRSLIFDHHHFWHDNLPSIKELVQRVHQASVDQLEALEFYASLFYGRFDLDKRTLSFIDCGFTKPLYFRKSSKKPVFIRACNFPLGTVRKHEYFPFEINFELGDLFILYSDGIVEAISPDGELYGEKRLSQVIEEYFDLNPEEISDKIKQSVMDFTGQEVLEDDFTLFIMQVEKFGHIEPAKSRIAKFNSVLMQLEAVRKLTKELCSRAPGDMERLSSELELAVDEAFTNIVMHGYGNKAGFPIAINRVYLPDEIVIELADQGKSFNPSEIPAINLFGDSDHGFGWHLIRQIADRVVYTPKNSQNGWNRLSIFKKYYTRRADIMEFTPFEKNGILIIQLDSEALDAKQVSEFKEQVIQILESKGSDHVIFDLHKLQFIDSSGLGAFLSLFRHLNMKGGHLSLAAMNKPVKTIFELVSMQKIFDCHDTVDLAMSVRENKKK